MGQENGSCRPLPRDNDLAERQSFAETQIGAFTFGPPGGRPALRRLPTLLGRPSEGGRRVRAQIACDGTRGRGIAPPSRAATSLAS